MISQSVELIAVFVQHSYEKVSAVKFEPGDDVDDECISDETEDERSEIDRQRDYTDDTLIKHLSATDTEQ